MCGILGIQSTKAINENLFIKSLNLMSHRGPDSEKIYIKKIILYWVLGD